MGKMSALALIEQRLSEVTTGFYSCDQAEQKARSYEYHYHIRAALRAAYGADAPMVRIDPWRAMSEVPMTDIPAETEEEDDRFDPDISLWHDDEDEDYLEEQARDFEEVHGITIMTLLQGHC